MKNFFVIFTILLLALADLGSSAPQKSGPASPPLSPLGIQDIATAGAAKDPFANVSAKCKSALTSVIQTGIMSCLPMDAILKLMANQELLQELQKDPLHAIPKLKPTFDDACSVKKCSDDLVQKAVVLVLGGCATDLASKIPIIQLIFAGLVVYSPAIDSICFKDQAGTFCLIETDNILLSLPPPQIPIKGLEKIPLLESVALASPNIICTPCNKAIINTLFDYYKDPKNALFVQVTAAIGYTTDVNNFANLGVDVKCGITPFNDGTIGDPTKGPDPPAPGHS